MNECAVATRSKKNSLSGACIRVLLPLAIFVPLLLVPATTALATGDSNNATCENEALTGFREYLADCRAYELVSPSYESGVDTPRLIATTPSGSRVLVGTRGVFAGTDVNPAAYELNRTTSGWSVESIGPAASEFISQGYGGARGSSGTSMVGASEDLSGTLWSMVPSSLASQYPAAKRTVGEAVPGAPGMGRLYVRMGGTFHLVGPMAPSLTGRDALHVVGASSSLTHILLSKESTTGEEVITAETYWPGDTTSVKPPSELTSLYEYSGLENQEPRLVAVSNEGRLEGSPVNAHAKLIGDCGAGLGGGEKGDVYNAVSSDGASVFFTVLSGQSADSECSESFNAVIPYEVPAYECTLTATGECPAAERTRLEAALANRLTDLSKEGIIAGPTEVSCLERDCEAKATAAPAFGPPVNELYARVDEEHTVAISEPAFFPGRECSGECEAQEEEKAKRQPAVFQGASRDGSEVFFMTGQSLVNQDEEGHGSGNDLYMAGIGQPSGVTKPEVTRLVQVSHDPNAGEAAEVQGVVRVAEDGTRVYYVAKGVLTGANREGRSPQAGADNLYVYDVSSGQNVFVATLLRAAEEASLATAEAAEESTVKARANAAGFAAFEKAAIAEHESSGEAVRAFALAEESTRIELEGTLGPVGTLFADTQAWSPADSGREAQATPDGLWLTFVSSADLTAGDTSTVTQVFEYDAQTQTLSRVSSGANPAVSAEAANIPSQEYEREFRPSEANTRLALSDDGTSVFFESGAQLTPSAYVHDRPNIYEYENDHVYLVSDGAEQTVAGFEENTNFNQNRGHFTTSLLGASAEGANVFFETADQLSPADGNLERDVYDARAGGGFPAALEGNGCEGSGCQGASEQVPTSATAGSASQAGGGNLAPVVQRKASGKRKAHNTGHKYKKRHKKSKRGRVTKRSVSRDLTSRGGR